MTDLKVPEWNAVILLIGIYEKINFVGCIKNVVFTNVWLIMAVEGQVKIIYFKMITELSTLCWVCSIRS